MFSMSWDPQSLQQISQLVGFQGLRSPEMQQAMQESGTILQQAVRGSMHWQNPSGALEDSIESIQDSAYEVQVGSALPYARRRDQGFDGTDSLGRTYHDVGAFYMESGMDTATPDIQAKLNVAMMNYIGRIGGS